MEQKVQLTIEIIEKILKLHDDGYSKQYLAHIFDMSTNRINNILTNKLKSINRKKSKFLTPNEVQEIIFLYNSQISNKKICNKFNISEEYLKNTLKRNNIVLRGRKHFCKYDDTVFEEINSHEKAYWLGVLSSDGCIASTNNMIYLNLEISDLDLIEKFKSFLKSTHKIGKKFKGLNSKNEEMWQAVFKIRSQKLKNDLIKLGIKPQKSMCENFPNIEKKYYNSFILGNSDGDGTWGMYKWDNNKKPIFSLCGGKDIIKAQQRILIDECNITEIKISKDKKNELYKLTAYSKSNITKIIYYLYKDSPICLDRKKNIVDNFLIKNNLPSITLKTY